MHPKLHVAGVSTLNSEYSILDAVELHHVLDALEEAEAKARTAK